MGCWALPKCQTPRCRVVICENVKELLLLLLTNYRANKSSQRLLPTSLPSQLSKNSAPEQRKLPVLVQPQRTPSVTGKQEEGASSSSEGTCSFVHLSADPLGMLQTAKTADKTTIKKAKYQFPVHVRESCSLTNRLVWRWPCRWTNIYIFVQDIKDGAEAPLLWTSEKLAENIFGVSSWAGLGGCERGHKNN